MTLEEEIRELICVMVKNHPKSAYYREPVIGFASASDPLYDQLDDLIGNPQIHPKDMLNGAQTVLVLFLPYSEVIYKDIKGECKTSSIWSDAYMHTNELLDHIMRQVQNLLELKGYHSVTEPPTENSIFAVIIPMQVLLMVEHTFLPQLTSVNCLQVLLFLRWQYIFYSDLYQTTYSWC